MGLVVAIDGPAGAGKSTVGRALADRLGLDYLDTGAMYRAIAFAALQRGVPEGDLAAIAEMAATVDICVAGTSLFVDGVDATEVIRGREVTAAVAQIASNLGVRTILVERQRTWVAERGGGVVEGRDIGSVVFPDADLKVFVTASPLVRARRRISDIGGDLDDVVASIIERDRKDSTRMHSPLATADDAFVVDTSELSVDAVVDQILRLIP